MATYTHDDNDITAEQTDNNTPLVVTASAEVAGNEGYQAFDHVGNSVAGWASDTGDNYATPKWLKVDFGAGNAKYLTGANLAAWSGGNSVRCGGNFTFDGSNNDSNWTALKTLAGESNFSSAEMRLYAWENTTAYRYFRIHVTSHTYSVWIAELEIFETIPTFKPQIMIF